MTAVIQVGPWECVELLGSGGNAKVWRATRDGGQTFVALKVLGTSNKSKESYLRFVKEVEFLTSLDDMTGVLPVTEHHLPTGRDAEKAWLAMPIAISLDEALANADLELVVEAVLAVATTLARLAETHNLHHRDIKPRNLYELDGAWLVGDFGLIDVPVGDDLTQNGQRMGPAHFVPYELISDPANAYGGPVDVYELAKTLWALATGLPWPPEGHQPANSAQFRIADYVAHPKAADLDRLVDRATLLQPTARPTMREVVDELTAWQQREVTQMEIDLGKQRAILHAKLAPQLAQLNLLEKRKDEALAAIRTVQERSKPLIEQLRGLYPNVEVGGYDKMSETLLMLDHIRWAEKPEHEWSRAVLVVIGDNPANSLKLLMAQASVLYSDGTLFLKWILYVGWDYGGGTRFSEEKLLSAPVGSIQQEKMIDEALSSLAERLVEAVKALAEAVPDLN
jgi:serine/threonine protein kinase